MWMHHSTGDEILKGGLLAALEANNVQFFDMNYKEGKVSDYVIGDHTDPPDFPKNFNTPAYFSVIAGWELPKGKRHDILMFKSCFPSSKIKSDAQLDQYKSWYKSLIPTFKKHDKILFIAMSTPPLIDDWTNAEQAKRARRWSKWITTEYPTLAANVKVFDLFNALAVREGFPMENRLAPQFGQEQGRDAHPSPAGAKAVTRMFIPWFNRAIRQAGLVKPSAAKSPPITKPSSPATANPPPVKPPADNAASDETGKSPPKKEAPATGTSSGRPAARPPTPSAAL